MNQQPGTATIIITKFCYSNVFSTMLKTIQVPAIFSLNHISQISDVRRWKQLNFSSSIRTVRIIQEFKLFGSCLHPNKSRKLWRTRECSSSTFYENSLRQIVCCYAIRNYHHFLRLLIANRLSDISV